MNFKRRTFPLRCLLLSLLALCLALAQAAAQAPPDPLPSWNDGPVKAAILKFVQAVTDKSSPQYVPPEERLAAFDQDGTLWVEQPMAAEEFFTMDRLIALAPQRPEWRRQQPFKAFFTHDKKRLAILTPKDKLAILMGTHAGMTTGEYEKIVTDWLAEARHPRFLRHFPELVYQPMLEVLAYFRAHGFKTYIVSGGGVDFIRPYSLKTYGIPPEQVVGSTLKLKFELRQGRPVLVRLPEMDLLDDGPGKPVGIEQFIGRRPLAAFGNSDGDLQMLEWTAAGQGARLLVLVHHTDAEREYAYDRQSGEGRLDKALDEAQRRGWTVVDMKRDWRRIFPFEESK